MTTKEDEKETTRVEAFSDGVYAVAITLLVLELKVPHASEPLAEGLVHLWPSFVAFVLGFATIGVMWLNHHRLFQMIHRCDDVLLFLNLLLLFCISLTPFPTAVMAEHLGTPNARTAALLYSGSSVLIAVAYNLLWRYAAKNGRLLGRHVDLKHAEALTKQYIFGPVYYAVAFVVAWFWSANVSVGICMALAIFFSLPLAHFMKR
jgi:TMEM175 potassium channel family protein